MTTFAKSIRLFTRFSLLIISLFFFILSLLSGADEAGGWLRGVIMNSPNTLPWVLLLFLNYLLFKWELMGGILVTLFGSITLFFFGGLNNQATFWLISAPLIFLGGLSVLAWILTNIKFKRNEQN